MPDYAHEKRWPGYRRGVALAVAFAIAATALFYGVSGASTPSSGLTAERALTLSAAMESVATWQDSWLSASCDDETFLQRPACTALIFEGRRIAADIQRRFEDVRHDGMETNSTREIARVAGLAVSLTDAWSRLSCVASQDQCTSAAQEAVGMLSALAAAARYYSDAGEW